MSQYMSIGKVSKLKNVSIKSLRYYDQIGILKPAFVNTETNYRYYTESQLYLLDAITVCIKLGIPLKDLNNYVNKDSINLQKLLYDGKILAEQKIMEIHNCLGTLQETLQKMTPPDLCRLRERYWFWEDLILDMPVVLFLLFLLFLVRGIIGMI